MENTDSQFSFSLSSVRDIYGWLFVSFSHLGFDKITPPYRMHAESFIKRNATFHATINGNAYIYTWNAIAIFHCLTFDLWRFVLFSSSKIDDKHILLLWLRTMHIEYFFVFRIVISFLLQNSVILECRDWTMWTYWLLTLVKNQDKEN